MIKRFVRRLIVLLLYLPINRTTYATTIPALSENAFTNKSQQPRSQVESNSFKLPFFEKFRQKYIQKLRSKLYKHITADQKSKETLSTISLICGVVGVACLFTAVTAVASIFLAPVAITTGIIALHRNQNKKSRRQAIAGIITGAVPILLIVILVILSLATFGGGIE